MMGRAGSDLGRWLLSCLGRLWPLFLFWYAWVLADRSWQNYLATRPQVPFLSGAELAWLSPIVILAGPALVMAALITLHRLGPASRTLALVGVGGMAAAALLTGWSDAQRLWPYLGDPRYSAAELFNAVPLADKVAIAVGLAAAYVGYCVATRARPLGRDGTPTLLRGRSDNFGHADWLPMDKARKRLPGPDPLFGGLVIGEVYRVDLDRAAKRGPFEPADKASWGMGGKAPLLVFAEQLSTTSVVIYRKRYRKSYRETLSV